MGFELLGVVCAILNLARVVPDAPVSSVMAIRTMTPKRASFVDIHGASKGRMSRLYSK